LRCQCCSVEFNSAAMPSIQRRSTGHATALALINKSHVFYAMDSMLE
jgi:hypothetical protein